VKKNYLHLIYTSTTIKSKLVLKYPSYYNSFFIKKRVKLALIREGVSNIPNIGASRVYIRPKIYKVNNNPIAKALRNN